MNENRVRLVIEADPTGAITSLGDFRQALDLSGASAKMTDAQLAKLADRFRDKLAADQATQALDLTRQQVERLGSSAGLSQTELAKLYRQLGLTPAAARSVQAALAGVAGGASEVTAALSGLIVKAGAAVAAYLSLRAAFHFVSESIQSAARYQTLGVVIEQVGQNAGYTKKEMDGFVAGVQEAGISMIESREAVAKMAAAQLDLSKASDLARVAQNAAVIAGTNSSEAFGKLVQGISTGQTILLHHMGIMVNLEDAYKNYAKQLGLVNKNELSENQKRMAALNAVLEEGEKRAGVYEAAMMTAGKQLQSFDRYVKDLKTTVGEAFLDSFTLSVFNASDAMAQLKTIMASPEAQEAMASLADSTVTFINWIIKKVPEAVKLFIELINSIRDLRKSLPENFGWLGEKIVQGYDAVSSAFSDASKKILEDRMSEANDNLYNATTVEAAKKFEAILNGLIEKYNELNNAAKSANEEAKKTAPSKEESSAKNKYWAEYNKGVREYNTIVQGPIAIGENNEKYLPIDEQKIRLADRYKKEIEQIRLAWMMAWQAGRWDDVASLNDSATAALGKYNAKLDDLARKQNKAADAINRYNEMASAFYDQTIASLDQLHDSLTGGLEKNASRTDKWFERMFDSIRQKVIAAKGDVAPLAAAWVALWNAWPGDHMLAVLKDQIAALQQEAQLLQSIASATGDPGMSYEAGLKSAQAWYARSKQLIADESQRAAMLAALRVGYEAKVVDAKVKAYSSVKEVSSSYWQAEKERLTQHLATVKAAADDETAYRIYAAEQWSWPPI